MYPLYNKRSVPVEIVFGERLGILLPENSTQAA